MGFMNWMFGGDATDGMRSQPKTADWQRTYLKTSTEQAAPTLGLASTAQNDQMRAQQGQLAGMLMGQAQGTRPGAGEMAVNRQIGQAQAQQTANSLMARGAQTGMAGKTAASNNAALGVNGAGQAAIAQMGDQQNAQQQLAGLLSGARQQDLTVRGQDIGVGQGNQQAQLAQQQQNLAALAQMLGVDQAALQADLAKRGMQMQDKGMFPTLLQVGGQVLAAKAGAK